jgi:hypothetical protein
MEIHCASKQRNREIEKQRNRETEKQRSRPTDRETNQETHLQHMQSQADRETHNSNSHKNTRIAKKTDKQTSRQT